MSRRTYGRLGASLRQARNQALLKRTPLCAKCGGPATEVDHIVPLHKGGAEALDNLQCLCHWCHKAKTRRDLAGSRATYDSDMQSPKGARTIRRPR